MQLDVRYSHIENMGDITKEHKVSWKKVKGFFRKKYQNWYSQSSVLIKQLLPDRYEEFVDLYRPDPKRRKIDAVTYKIQDWLNGVGSATDHYGEKYFDDFAIASMRFNTQYEILVSLRDRFESSLFEIKTILQADLHDSELDSARELLKNGYHRAAGIIAGVTIEGHLKVVCDNHKLKISQKNPTISTLNDTLKKGSVIDIPMFRFIQRMSDIRNLCGHKRERDPTNEEVSELIDGTDKVIKTVF